MAVTDRGLPPDDPAYAGQREYTPAFLRVYDPMVLGLYCRAVWRCPAGRLVEHYTRNLGRRHLDVGPGTGFFLRRADLPGEAQLTLLDPNPHVLAHAGHRLAHLTPTVVAADVCKPLPLDGPFDSVAMNLVVHCLPSTCKAAALRSVAGVLAPDGVLFGSTVLGTPQLHTRLSRPVLRYVNQRGIFDNLADTEVSVRGFLSEAFEAVELDVHGSVAVFAAARPRA